jgi:3-methyl-2-oxobutanoate hydroxymethyltransferase
MAVLSSLRVTAPDVLAHKGAEVPLVMVTAYDAPTARTADAAGADLILVGDSVAMVVLGYPDTLQVTTADMCHHVAAVARTQPRALMVGDLPWLSYHVSRDETVHNAAALIRAGAGAVKLEGGRKRLDAISAILDAEIPVMGHLGLTPQSVNRIGGYKAQGRTAIKAQQLLDDALALEGAGCFAIVLEAMPEPVAGAITRALSIPTIGIGAGAQCGGQVLVWHDMLGLTPGHVPKFVKQYADIGRDTLKALEAYVADVRAGRFPEAEHTYAMAEDQRELFEADLASFLHEKG